MCTLPHPSFQSVYSPFGRGGRGIKSQNKLISREHKLTSCYQMAFLWQEKSEQGKQQYLLFATSNPSEWRVFTTTWKFPHYLGGLKKGRGRDPDCVPDVVSFCLSDHSSAWIFPPSFFLFFFFSAQLLSRRPGQGESSECTSTIKGSHLIFISVLMIFINPYMLMPIAPLFPADFPIKDLFCR